MRLMTLLIALPFLVLAVIVAKLAQYSAVEALGGQLGFELASLVGLGPVLGLYFWLHVKYPKFSRYGLRNGRP